MSSPTLYEGPFDTNNLKALAFTPKISTSQEVVSMATKIYIILMNNRNDHEHSARIRVDYGPPKNGFGNDQAQTPSIQHMKKEYRILLTVNQLLYDIDMVASGIQLMVQVFERIGIVCTLTRAYLENREDVLRMISRDDREKAKKEIDRAVFLNHVTCLDRRD
jgi:hypothetical protein